MAIVYTRTISLAAAADDGIAEAQTPGAAGDLVLDGAFVTGGVAVLDVERQVLFTFTGDETGKDFTLYGTNASGTAQQEVIAGDTGTATSVLFYKTVTRIAIDAAAADAIEVGTNGVGGTSWFNIDTMREPINVGFQVIVDGTIDYTVQYTTQDFWSYPVVPISGFNHATVAAKTDNQAGSITFPVTGIRVLVNSGDGSATITYTQAGP